MAAAAGNDALNLTRWPAGYYGVLGVSGVNTSGNHTTSDNPCYPDNPGSNWGVHVDIAAPFWALSTVPDDGYEDEDEGWCGTSMATPYVSAAAALVRAKHPTWTNSQVMIFLQNNAQDKGSPGWDYYYGYGVLDLGTLGNLTGSIDGPDEVNLTPLGECTWEAKVTGGEGNYSYQWSGILSGTGSSITGRVYSSGWLNLQVTATIGTRSTRKYITVDPEAPDCE